MPNRVARFRDPPAGTGMPAGAARQFSMTTSHSSPDADGHLPDRERPTLLDMHDRQAPGSGALRSPLHISCTTLRPGACRGEDGSVESLTGLRERRGVRRPLTPDPGLPAGGGAGEFLA